MDGSINDPPSSKEAEYREKPLPGGGILGQLTTIGYKQAYAVGQYLRLDNLSRQQFNIDFKTKLWRI